MINIRFHLIKMLDSISIEIIYPIVALKMFNNV